MQRSRSLLCFRIPSGCPELWAVTAKIGSSVWVEGQILRVVTLQERADVWWSSVLRTQFEGLELEVQELTTLALTAVTTHGATAASTNPSDTKLPRR
ncbi:hypothetical protein Taro_049055 [Colocasia esculenta]|uniref:Uncharacterized protein n=1 Tax=Colocasia esculenta TaxID=4460 RepID=A0A843X9U4_COLES|nr:hypothetical protein [Colocasia esculenta]